LNSIRMEDIFRQADVLVCQEGEVIYFPLVPGKFQPKYIKQMSTVRWWALTGAKSILLALVAWLIAALSSTLEGRDGGLSPGEIAFRFGTLVFLYYLAKAHLLELARYINWRVASLEARLATGNGSLMALFLSLSEVSSRGPIEYDGRLLDTLGELISEVIQGKISINCFRDQFYWPKDSIILVFPLNDVRGALKKVDQSRWISRVSVGFAKSPSEIDEFFDKHNTEGFLHVVLSRIWGEDEYAFRCLRLYFPEAQELSSAWFPMAFQVVAEDDLPRNRR
jgi:hypothetical protein